MPTGYKIAFVGGKVLSQLAATGHSDPIVVSKASVWSVHMVYGGATPTVAVVLQATNIPNPDFTTDTDWVTDTTVTFAGVAGSAGKELIEIGNSGAAIYRLKLTISGTALVDCYTCQKTRAA